VVSITGLDVKMEIYKADRWQLWQLKDLKNRLMAAIIGMTFPVLPAIAVV